MKPIIAIICVKKNIVLILESNHKKSFKYNIYLYITNLLYESVCNTISSIVNGKVSLKRKYDLKYMPGFFSFLHTFGKNLKINPPLTLFFC